MSTSSVAVPAHMSLVYYRKFVFQLAGLAGAVLLVFVDATTRGGVISGVTWWVAVGAAVQAAATYFPTVWWTKFLASAVGVVFSAVAAAITSGWTTAEILAVAWQILAWVASGAVDNGPRPVPTAAPPYPSVADAGRAATRLLLAVTAVLVAVTAALVGAAGPAHARVGAAWVDPCPLVLAGQAHFPTVRQAQFAVCRRTHRAGPVVLVRPRHG